MRPPVVHVWHKDLERFKIIAEENFDPKLHIKKIPPGTVLMQSEDNRGSEPAPVIPPSDPEPWTFTMAPNGRWRIYHLGVEAERGIGSDKMKKRLKKLRS